MALSLAQLVAHSDDLTVVVAVAMVFVGIVAVAASRVLVSGSYWLRTSSSVPFTILVASFSTRS